MANGYNASQTEVLESSGNILVSASAGSGKTTVMVEKIFRLILEGYDVSRMAVMTFSRAAATEMKNRLVKKLYEAIRRGGEGGSRALKQLEKFPFSNIGTIDGFCYTLLKRYYAVIGADPSATPMDPDESDVIWAECVDKACETALADERFIPFAEKYSSSRKWDNVKRLITSLKIFLSVQDDKEIFLRKDFSDERKKYVKREYLGRFKSLLSDIEDAVIVLRFAGMRDEEQRLGYVKEFLEGLTEDNIFEMCREYSPPPSSQKRKAEYAEGKEKYNAIVAYLSKASEEVAEFVDLLKTEEKDKETEILFFVTDIAMDLYAARKRKEGKLDFGDLSEYALKILSYEDIAAEIKGSFDFIFVDEYQDTNYLQERILNGISSGDNVFVVGDVKQAIYKFRYAEPEIFKERMRAYAEGKGKNIHLSENYRSESSILEFANEVCSVVMTDAYCGVDYKANPMVAGAEFAEDGGGVEIYVYEKEKNQEKSKGVYSVRNAPVEEERDVEGEFIAAKILEYVGNGEIYRPKLKTARKVGFGDIAVLTRKSDEGLRIAAALEGRNIPYSVNDEDKDLYYPRELLVDFLRLIVADEDAVVINVMSSPVFGFSADELMDIGVRDTKTSFWEAVTKYNDKDELTKKAKRFVAYVDDLRKKSAYLSARDLMIKVLSDGLDGYFASRADGAGSRISKFLTSAGAASNVSDFLEWYDEAYKGEKPPSRPDSVQIMTMHKSKGLEFPIVFLPYSDDGRAETNIARSMFFADRDLGVALKSVDENSDSKDTFATKALKLKKYSDGRQELARLMYVDFTRAENKLIITGKKIKKNSGIYDINSILGFICYAAKRSARIKTLFRNMEIIAPAEATIEEEGDAAVDFSRFSAKYPYEKATVLPSKQTVSEIVEEEEEMPSTKTYTYGKGGDAALGTAYHLFMQRADLSEKSILGIKNEISALVEKNEISAEIAEKIDVEKVQKLLNSEVIKLASACKAYREQPFIYPERKEGGYTLIQGVIDLLVEEEDGLIVVDFKASGLDRERLVARYRRQVEIYALAAEKIFAKPVKKRILLNILKGYEAEI